MDKKHIVIFTDGASKGNPGPGGWGVVILYPEPTTGVKKVFERGGHDEHTTNNRMELSAAIESLIAIKHIPGDVVIHTDSSYVIQGITKWVKGWIKNGWTTSTQGEVQNRDLWEVLTGLMYERETRDGEGTIEWKHIAGHSGVPGNERVDEIASAYAEGKRPELYDGPADAYEVDLLVTAANRTIKTVRDTKRTRSNKKAYSYLSMIDGKIETYKTWEECEKKVRGVKGAKYKKALSAAEEQEIKDQWSK